MCGCGCANLADQWSNGTNGCRFASNGTCLHSPWCQATFVHCRHNAQRLPRFHQPWCANDAREVARLERPRSGIDVGCAIGPIGYLKSFQVVDALYVKANGVVCPEKVLHMQVVSFAAICSIVWIAYIISSRPHFHIDPLFLF